MLMRKAVDFGWREVGEVISGDIVSTFVKKIRRETFFGLCSAIVIKTEQKILY